MKFTRNIANGGVFSIELFGLFKGLIIVQVSGKGSRKAFANEPGGHRWQRVPPTEKRGRVHTSTITVAVLPIPTKAEFNIPDSELRWKACRGSGSGGQKRNVTDSAIQLTHIPTGTMVRCETERSQNHNLNSAKALLFAKLRDGKFAQEKQNRNAQRKDQVGSGMRGDKRRTVRQQAGQVIDHVTGRTISSKRYLDGELETLAK